MLDAICYTIAFLISLTFLYIIPLKHIYLDMLSDWEEDKGKSFRERKYRNTILFYDSILVICLLFGMAVGYWIKFFSA